MVRYIPNALTVMRLALTVLFLGLILHSPQASNRTALLDGAFVLFLIAALSDIADGIIARRYNVTSKFGRIVDPLADKVLVCGAFICFAIVGEPRLFNLSSVTLGIIHWGVAGILIMREAYVTILRQWAEAHGINFAATASGKFKMLTQSFAIGTVLVKMGHVQTATWGYWFTSITYAVMVTATVISGLRSSRRPCLKETMSEV